MITGKNLIGYSESAKGTNTFCAFSPLNLKELDEVFTETDKAEVELAFEKADAAFKEYRLWSGSRKSSFLNKITEHLESNRKHITARAVLETGLTEARLNNEMNRTINQIKMFAALVLEGSWVEASIDRAVPDRPGTPKPDIRKMLRPLGPVVVFGASNFPLAFSVAGGDTTSALAAGNPVLVKAHPSHPGTSELVARTILAAARESDAPEGVFSMLVGKGFDSGQMMVKNPHAKAVAFTGSLAGGKALYDLAQQREEPIPVFAEMGSLNPIFVMRDKQESETSAIAGMIASSVNMGAGQFCTKPGLVIMEETPKSNDFVDYLRNEFSSMENQVMLNEGISSRYNESINYLANYSNVEILYSAKDGEKLRGRPVIAVASAQDFISNPSLQYEVFGPYTLVVRCSNKNEMKEIASSLAGQLSVTFFAGDREMADNCDLVNLLEDKTGRLIFNEVPTGLEVCSSTQHGGPFPATTDSRFTSVGTGAIKRFVRPVAYQNWPDNLLPAELRDDNPLSIWRLDDNQWHM